MPTQKAEIKELLKGGLKEIDLSKYPFDKVLEVLKELGYIFSESKYKLDGWINTYELDYWAYLFKDNKYTGYSIEGSFRYGTCKLVYYGLYD